MREYTWQPIVEPKEEGALFRGHKTGAIYVRDSRAEAWYEVDDDAKIKSYLRGYHWRTLLQTERRLIEIKKNLELGDVITIPSQLDSLPPLSVVTAQGVSYVKWEKYAWLELNPDKAPLLLTSFGVIRTYSLLRVKFLPDE